MSTTVINGELILDQTTGLQDDDVAVSGAGGTLTGSLDPLFLTYLNGLGLTQGQLDYADDVEAANQTGFITVTPGAGESIALLEFGAVSGSQVFLDDGVTPLTTVSGSNVFLWRDPANHNVILATSGGIDDTVIAAFYLKPNATNTNGDVQMITFESLSHPLGGVGNADDTVDFGELLKVRVLTETLTDIGDDVHVDDDGPTITAGDSDSITVDETDLNTPSDADFSTAFDSDFGTDGEGNITYKLSVPLDGTDSGLVETASGEAVLLYKVSDALIEGRTATGDDVVFTVAVDSTGKVTLTQISAVRHDPDSGPDQNVTLDADNLIGLTATITDADTDTDEATVDIGQNLNFEDDAPTAPTLTAASAVAEDESAGVNATADPNLADDTADAAVAAQFAGTVDSGISFAKSAAPLVSSSGGGFGNDGAATSGSVDYSITTVDGTDSGLDTTGGDSIFLFNGIGGLVVGRVGDSTGDVAFALAIDDDGFGYLAQAIALDNGVGGSDGNALDNIVGILDAAVQVTVTYTDKDGDSATSDATDVGALFTFQDDGPAITQAVSYGGTDTSLNVANETGGTDTGDFAYDIGNDTNDYAAGESDFIDSDAVTAGTQISLSGTVSGPPSTAITNPLATLSSEDASSAEFAVSYNYDKDPLTTGFQSGAATGILSFDKVAGTFTYEATSAIEGFSFNLLHTSEFLAKQPTGNTGHPEIVVERLAVDDANTTQDEDFYLQFTANTRTTGGQNPIPFGFNSVGEGAAVGDSVFNNAGATHDLITNLREDWVSATQTTNGVAGDTIQQNEALTLRFFSSDILGDVATGTEKTNPTAQAQGITLEFDGIGNNEDLMIVLDLIDDKGTVSTADDVEISRAIYVQNSDIYKNTGTAIPAPYAGEFVIDNNDGLVIIESNDFNFGSENFAIQGVQIMQSGNGLTGQAINLEKATGDAGASSSTLVAWDGSDTDVLKIVDLAFLQSGSGTQSASLEFEFALHDGDTDFTSTQTIAVNQSNDFIV